MRKLLSVLLLGAASIAGSAQIQVGSSPLIFRHPGKTPASKVAKAPAFAPGSVNLIGNFYESQDPSRKGRVARMPLPPREAPEILGGFDIDTSWGGFMRDGKYYATYQWILSETMAYSTVKVYDPLTWTATATKFNMDHVHSILASATAYNAEEDLVYGAYLSVDGTTTRYEFGTADYDAMQPAHTAIAPITGSPWSALAFDADGTLYVITAAGDFGTVDKATGEVAVKGATGVISQALSSAVIDPKTGRFFWAVNNPELSGIYEVDKVSGAATLLAEFPAKGDFVGGLYIGAPLAADKAPDKVEELTIDFPDGTLNGNISFTAPASNFDGSEGTGTLDWTILSNGSVAKRGTAAYGEAVSEPVSVSMATDYKFEVYCSNAEGDGPRASREMFVGNGTPLAPENVTLSYADGKMSLAWDAVDKVVGDKGNFDPAELTYTVTRYPDGVVVSEGGKETSFSEALDEPETRKVYYYGVKAVFREAESAQTDSPQIPLGALSAPWVTDFSDYVQGLGDLTVLDANGDGATWGYMGGSAAICDYAHMTTTLPLDDWLFSPGLKLVAGETYVFSVSERWMPLFGSTARPDIEIFMGNSATVDGMTDVLMERVAATETTATTHRFVITPETTGTYFFGLHAIAENGNFMYVDEMKLTTGAIPAAVMDLEAIPAADCSYSATVRFKAPDTDVAKRPLTSLTKIEIYRAETMLRHTIENPEPGKEYEFVDDNMFYGSGNYMWTVRVFNESGEGLEASVVEYVGIPVLCAQPPLMTSENGDTGEVTFTWDPIFKSQGGRDVDPSFVTFDVITNGGYIATGLPSDTRNYTFQAVPEGKQGFVAGVVSARTQPGSASSVGKLLAVGAPYSRYFNSFSLAEGEPEVATDASRLYGQWVQFSDGTIDGLNSSDGDGGFFGIANESVGAGAELYVGKFDFSGMTHPVLQFDLFRAGDYDKNTIKVLIDEGEGLKECATIVSSEVGSGDMAWVTAKADLSAYAGKKVHMRLDGNIASFSILAIDRMKVMEFLDCNLTAGKIVAPGTVYPGIPYRVTAFVENNGTNQVESYVAVLKCNGKEVARQQCEALASDKTASVTFELTPDLLSAAELGFTLEVVCDGDMDMSDNVSETVTVKVVLPDYPAVNDLSATDEGDGVVSLAWSEPQPGEAEDVTVDFEDAEAFAIDSYGNWTFVDGDGKTTQTFMLSFTNAGMPMSFTVHDGSSNDYGFFNGMLMPHSGTKCLSSWGAADETQVDDWAISPRLAGSAQTLKFFAKAYDNETNPEVIEVLYSVSGNNVGDFTSLGKIDKVDVEWTEYSFGLPEGATFFAIRRISPNGWVLQIDDASFKVAGNGSDLALMGYNVYRNGVKINDGLVEDNAFTDRAAEDGDNAYVVTAVYDKGESAASNEVSLQISSLERLEAAGISVKVVAGEIVVEGAEGKDLAVADASGRMYFSAMGSAKTVVAVPAGIYLVTVAQETIKVVVG